jgi:PAS domain S-box-containing protein
MSETRPIRILGFSPNQAGCHAIHGMLQQSRFEVQTAVSVAEAVQLTLGKPDLILIDFASPNKSGLELCDRLKAIPTTASIPILPVFLGLVENGNQVDCDGKARRNALAAGLEPLALIAAIETLLRVRVTQQKFQHFLEAAPDAVVIGTPDGKIDQINAQTEKLFGYSRDELIGQPVEILMPVRFRSRHVEHRSAYVESPSTRPMGTGLGLYGQRKNGEEFPIEISLSPLPTEDGNLVASIIRDITAHRNLEAELRHGKRDLEQASRSKDEFLATLAHELRNPLAPIRNAVEYLDIPGLTAPDLKTARDVIARQLSQMTRLIDDLRDVSRITSNKLELRKERIELADIVQSAVESSRSLIQQCGHELSVSLPPMPVFLDADLTRLAQVILNLLNNSAKYTARGGHISLSAERQGSDVVLSVRDDGIGISKHMLPRIFDMFTQVDHSLERSQGGLGIGLTLVRRLVEMHDGRIEAHSEGLGEGSEFIVRLPILIQPRVAPIPSDAARFSDLNRHRILVVDDNCDAADSLGMLLRLKGNEIRNAHDGLYAIEVAESFRPDLILLDIGLPKLNGYEVARRIRQQPWGRDIVLVALTGWVQDEDKIRSKEAGFDFHLAKPLELAALESLLAEPIHS